MSSSAKFDVASLEVNVKEIDESLLSAPSETIELLMTKEGPVPSYDQLNCSAAVFSLPAASVNAPAATSIDVAPSLVGVNVAV